MAREDLARAIRQRDVAAIVTLLFQGNPPTIRSGFRTETELWDYKSDCPKFGRESINAWAGLSIHVLSFHNNVGGVLAFGIRDDFSFAGATTRLDSSAVSKILALEPQVVEVAAQEDEFGADVLQPPRLVSRANRT